MDFFFLQVTYLKQDQHAYAHRLQESNLLQVLTATSELHVHIRVSCKKLKISVIMTTSKLHRIQFCAANTAENSNPTLFISIGESDWFPQIWASFQVIQGGARPSPVSQFSGMMEVLLAIPAVHKGLTFFSRDRKSSSSEHHTGEGHLSNVFR